MDLQFNEEMSAVKAATSMPLVEQREATQNPNTSVTINPTNDDEESVTADVGQDTAQASAPRYPTDPGRLKNFKLFPKLPVELRLKIWMLSLENRTIEMRFANNYRSTQYDFVFSKIPTMLHVHKESRVEGLRYYKLLFGHKKQCRRPVYFNPMIDRLHLRDLTCGSIYPKQVAATLQLMPNKEDVRLLSIKREWLNWANTLGELRPFLLLFPNLEQLRVCSTLPEWHVIYQAGVGMGHAKHAGRCKSSDTGGSCFIPYSDVQFTKLGKQNPEPDSNYSEKERNTSDRVVRDFLERYEGNFWGTAEWKRPAVVHGVLCVKNVQTPYCPHLELGRAKAKRDANSAKIQATPQGRSLSGEDVGQSNLRD